MCPLAMKWRSSSATLERPKRFTGPPQRLARQPYGSGVTYHSLWGKFRPMEPRLSWAIRARRLFAHHTGICFTQSVHSDATETILGPLIQEAKPMKRVHVLSPLNARLTSLSFRGLVILGVFFSLTASAAPLSEVEPNDNAFEANSLPFKQPIYGQLYSELDQDYFIYTATKGSPRSVNGYFQCSSSQGSSPSGTTGYLIRIFSPAGLQASYTISEALCTNTFGFVMPTTKAGRYSIAISAPPQVQSSTTTFAQNGLGYVLALGSRSVSNGFCPPGKSPTKVPIPATPQACGRTWIEFCHPFALECQ